MISSSISNELKNKDRLVSIDGISIETLEQFDAMIDQRKVGDSLTIVYERDSETHETQLVLGEYKPDSSIDFQK